jgi:serine-type D-Ala-D-Ala carboxypeptidase/endopeptidase (penicillin-binding protein 4)
MRYGFLSKIEFFLPIVCCLLPLFPFPLQAQSSTTVGCRQELAREIEIIIDRPQFKRSHWGIIIQNQETKETIYQLNSDKSFIPASTVKLLTTAAVLRELGANFRIATPIYATGELPSLETVRIQGKGDPTLTLEILKNIVQQFKTLGIKSIKKLIIDDSYFARPVINPTWEWGDTYYDYATTVNSVILQQNKVRLTLVPQAIGQPIKLQWSDALAAKQWQVFNQGITAPANAEYSIEIDGILGKPTLNIRGKLPTDNQADEWDLAIIDPAHYFLETWRELLSKEGIAVTQGLVTTEAINSKNERVITQMYSPPLKELIIETNRESNNLYAEVLLKILAKELKMENEIEALEQSLTKLGINSDNYSLVDGSGLSRHNLLTPETLIDILTVMSTTPEKDLYQTSLSLAGVNGTLKNRWQNTEIQNNLWGKTGNLSGVIALSGYVKLSDREFLVLSIVVNNFDDKNKIAQQAMDEIILLLPQFSDCFQSP